MLRFAFAVKCSWRANVAGFVRNQGSPVTYLPRPVSDETSYPIKFFDICAWI